jgi:hypothetical protein
VSGDAGQGGDLPLWQQQRQRAVAKHPGLVALARALLSTNPTVKVDELRMRAVAAQLLTGQEQGRTLSYLSGVMKAAGGEVVGYAKSETPSRHGAVVALWSSRRE